MMMRTFAGLAFALCLLAPTSTSFSKKAEPYAAALADSARPAAHRERDAARKPADLLSFARVKKGQKIADYIMGGGYLTHILAAAVGPKGKVYAYQPVEFVAFRAAYGTEQDAVAKAHANIAPVRTLISQFSLPEKVDTIVTVQNFHDLYLKPMPPGTVDKGKAALFAALKPGGILVVVDHVALAGSAIEAPDKLHRIDPAFARAELEKAGFKYEGETTMWRNTADPHTANVFSPDIRGKTDQFAYRFRKPK
jgi:predicted methyltransferase